MTTNLDIPTLGKTQLVSLEARVRNGLASFVDVGTALAEIRDGRGYKIRGFKTFELYCEKEFGFTDRHGRRLIAAAETTEKVKKVFGEAPRVESVAREFEKVANEPDKLRRVKEILAKQKKTAATATAEDVAAAVLRLNGKSSSVHRDPPKPVSPTFVFTDTCPYCHVTPDSYLRDAKGNTWQCGGCHHGVAINVMASNMKTCKNCKKPVPADVEFCNHCGELL